jgi:HEAT repeat protein
MKEHRIENSRMSRIPAHFEFSKPQKTLVLPKPKEAVPLKSEPNKDANAPAKVDISKVKTGSTIVVRKPGQPALSDGSSVVQSVFSGVGNNTDQPKDSAETSKEKTGTAEEKPKDVSTDNKKPETPPPAPSRIPDKKNCLYLIEKGSSRERFDAIAFAAKEKITNAVPVLGDVLKKETRFSAAAASALSAIGGSRAASALYSEVEKGVVPDMRLAAFSALLSMNDPSEDRYLVKCFSHKDATIRYWAVQAAAVRSLPAARSRLEAILADTYQLPDIKIWAAAGVERLSSGDSQARSVLLSALHGRSRETAAIAMDALASIGSAWSVGEIAGLLYSDDARVAGNILELLCRIEPANALAALENASGGYRHTPRYKTTRMAILETPDHAAIAEAIVSQDALARSLAIEEAAHFKSETAVPALAALARSTSGGAERDHAVAALKAIGNTEAKDTLTALGESPVSAAPAAPQFRVTRVYNDGLGGLKGVMISDGAQEFICSPGEEAAGGWTLKSVEQGQALLENKDGRRISLTMPAQSP